MKNFFFIFILIFISKNLYAYNLFETKFYDVEFVSDNIVNDKLIKIDKIKKETLLHVFDKILEKQYFNILNNNLSNDQINLFIKNIIVNDEKIINNKYFSKVKINLNKKKIIEFLRHKKIPYVDYYPNKFLLIIYEENDFIENLFSKNNSYYSYFNENLIGHNFFKIPNLDINDRFLLNKDDLIKKEYEKIINFSKKYNSEQIIVIFSKTENRNKYYNILLLSNGKVEKRTINLEKINYDIFFKLLEIEALDIWKSIHKIQNITINTIKCKVNYYNLNELKVIRKKLSNISTIYNLNTKSLSFRSVEYDILYFGNKTILKNLLNLNNIKIKNINNNCSIMLK